MPARLGGCTLLKYYEGFSLPVSRPRRGSRNFSRHVILIGIFFAGVLLALAQAEQRLPQPPLYVTGWAGSVLDHMQSGLTLGSVKESTLIALEGVTSSEDLFIGNIDRFTEVPKTIGPTEIYGTPMRAMSWFYLLSFSLFGMNLSSVVYTWFLLFGIGAGLALYVPFNGRDTRVLGLVIGSAFFVLGLLPFIDHNSWNVLSYRVMPFLGLIPAVTTALAISNRIRIRWPTAIYFGIMIGFVTAVRPTFIWVAPALAAAGFIWLRRNSWAQARRGSLWILIFFVASGSSFAWLSTLQDRVPQGIETVEVLRDSSRWLSMNLALFVDPRLYEKYVCGAPVEQSGINGLKEQECTGRDLDRLTSLAIAADIRNRVDDQKGYSGAVNWVSRENLELTLALPEQTRYGDLTSFNLNWANYGVVSRTLFFEIVTHEPIVVLENYVLVKPIRLGLNTLSVGYSVFESVYGGERNWLSAAAVLVSFSLIAWLWWTGRREWVSMRPDEKASAEKTAKFVLVLAGCAALPSMVFYSENYSVLDFTVLLMSAILGLAQNGPLFFGKHRESAAR